MTSSDTTPSARTVQLETLRAMGPARRLALALELSEEIRELALAGIARRHPEMSRPEQLAELDRATRAARTANGTQGLRS